MSSKMASYISLFVIMIGGVIYLMSARSLGNRIDDPIGPDYFPMILSIFLIVLCFLGIIQTLLKKDKTNIDIQNFNKTMINILVVIVFLISWSQFGVFYLQSIVCLIALFLINGSKENRFSKKNVINKLFLSMGTTVFIYLFFGVILSVKF